MIMFYSRIVAIMVRYVKRTNEKKENHQGLNPGGHSFVD